MEIVLYMAMTAAEFQENSRRFPHIAWMAGHFSPYGTGLSNLPTTMPEGSVLMLNDRTPVCGHDPERIAAQLNERMQEWKCDGIVLDFQRPDDPQTRAIAERIAALPFPVAVTPAYAEGLSCGVFLPPIPPTSLPETYLSPWQGREIWLDVAPECRLIRVTAEGSREIEDHDPGFPCPHTDQRLHCRYGMEAQKTHIDFHLRREKAEVESLIEEMSKRGVSRFLGLYQQLGSSFSQPMAQETARFQD